MRHWGGGYRCRLDPEQERMLLRSGVATPDDSGGVRRRGSWGFPNATLGYPGLALGRTSGRSRDGLKAGLSGRLCKGSASKEGSSSSSSCASLRPLSNA
eukprot:1108633-Prorocentrum_minimum.AAC.1